MFFLGNFNCQKIVFNIKRKSITLMAAAKKISWRELSKKFNVCPLANRYLFSLLPVTLEHEKILKI